MSGPPPVDWWSLIASERGQIVLAGAAGGVVRWLTLRDHWSDGAPGIVVGAILAAYAGPLAEPAFRWVLSPIAPGTAFSAPALSGFVMGLAGVAFSGLVIDAFRRGAAELRRLRQEKEP